MKRFFALLCPIWLSMLPSAVKADSSGQKQVSASLTIFVPARNMKLKEQKVKGKLYRFMPTALTTYASVVATKALPLLFQKSPASFPKGTKLMNFPVIKDDVMQVSLSKEFLQHGFWNSKQRTFLAVYSIVNTAGQDYDGSLRVRLLIEGKPFRNLANMDMRQPLRPRSDIVIGRKAN